MASSDWVNWQRVFCKQFSVGRLCWHYFLGYVLCVVCLFGVWFWSAGWIVKLSDIRSTYVDRFVSGVVFWLAFGMVMCDVEVGVCSIMVLGRRVGADGVSDSTEC